MTFAKFLRRPFLTQYLRWLLLPIVFIQISVSLNEMFIYCLLVYTEAATRDVLKKSLLKNFAKFTGKHLCQNPFLNKFAVLRPATLLKKRLWHSCFPVHFAKFLRTPIWQDSSG